MRFILTVNLIKIESNFHYDTLCTIKKVKPLSRDTKNWVGVQWDESYRMGDKMLLWPWLVTLLVMLSE